MAQAFDTSGIWHSKYRYTSTSRGQRLTGEHDVQLLRTGNDIVIQSLPTSSGSYVLLRLVFDGQFLTGTWHEYTAPTGHYEGSTYYGVIQFKLEDNGNAMRGKWLGRTRDEQSVVETDAWEIVRVDRHQKA